MNFYRKKLLLSAALAGALPVFVVGCDNLQGESRRSLAPDSARSSGADSTVSPGAVPADTTVGTKIDDSVITAKVKSALLADSALRSFDPKVETRKGQVQLSGFVDSQQQMDRAVSIANSVEGVQGVENNMSIKSGGSGTVGARLDDSIVTTKVKSALLADANTKSFDIGVVTRKGKVQLSGYVDDQTQMNRAITVARGIEGVKSVENKMSIKQ